MQQDTEVPLVAQTAGIRHLAKEICREMAQHHSNQENKGERPTAKTLPLQLYRCVPTPHPTAGDAALFGQEEGKREDGDEARLGALIPRLTLCHS